jgi:hypothetical protein
LLLNLGLILEKILVYPWRQGDHRGKGIFWFPVLYIWAIWKTYRQSDWDEASLEAWCHPSHRYCLATCSLIEVQHVFCRMMRTDIPAAIADGQEEDDDDDDEGALEEEEQAKRRMPVLKTRLIS